MGQIEALKEQVKLYRFDYVTGLKQRHDFEHDARTKFEQGSYYLTMYDIDGLHTVNRIKGYDVGDALIKRIANDIKILGGRSYRIGGDEFMTINCERPLTAKVRNTTYATIYTGDYDTFDEALKILDEAIIRKKIGTNRRKES